MDLKVLIELAQNYGLGIVLSMAVFFLLYFVLRNLLKGFKEHTNNLTNFVSKQQLTIDNHLQHLTEAVIKQEVTLASTSETFKAGTQRICDSIDNQTKHIIDMIRFKEDKNG